MEPRACLGTLSGHRPERHDVVIHLGPVIFGMLLGMIEDGCPIQGVIRMSALAEHYAGFNGVAAPRTAQPYGD